MNTDSVRRPAAEPYARPHDLLFIAAARTVLADGPLPAWADRRWLDWAPAVVRRAAAPLPGIVPVGLRGRERHQRFAAWLPERDVATVVTPESLSQARTWQHYPDWRDFAPIRALETLAPRLEQRHCVWGVTGSVGFSIASSLRVLNTGSDLDLLLRLPEPMSRAEARTLLQLTADLPCRSDIQVETPYGAFALLEWARAVPRVLLKTQDGPRLTPDPWTAPLDDGDSA